MKLRYKILNGFLGILLLAIVALALVVGYTKDCGPAPEVSGDGDLIRAAVHRCYGSPDVVEIVDVEKPEPGDDEVLVKVHAASVNPLDYHYMRGSPYLMRLGTGIGTPDDPRLGVDFAGTVESVGSKVTRYKPGDEVFGGAGGAFAEYVTIAEDRGLATKPDNVSFEQAASVPIAGITALQALRDSGKLQAGQKVLINGASGGVGTFAVQIAKSLGAEVTGVCSTRNIEMVRSLGADHVFDYKKENYIESGNQYDLIVDMVGNHSPLANSKVLTPEGRLVIVGGKKGNWVAPLMGPIKAMVTSPFVDQEMFVMLAKLNAEDMATLANLMESGEMTPVIDRSYSLGDVPDAIRYSEEGHARGKIVIEIE